MDLDSADAISIATAVREAKVSAVEVVSNALKRIEAQDIKFNCFTAVIQTALVDAKKNCSGDRRR